jgi:putative redox protein
MYQNIKFENNNGDQLAAILEIPESKIIGYAIFAHCFTCSKNLNAVRNIGKALVAKGIAVLRFDFTGLGESEGIFENSNFSSNVEDLVSAANFLTVHHQAPDLLIGHSLGGAAVIFATGKITSLKAIATIGAPANPGHVAHLFEHKKEEIKSEGVANVSIGGRSFKVKQQFLDDIQSKKIEEVTKNLRIPLMVLHSPSDTTVEISNAARIYKAAHDKADHLLSNKDDSVFAGTMIATWASRYL